MWVAVENIKKLFEQVSPHNNAFIRFFSGRRRPLVSSDRGTRVLFATSQSGYNHGMILDSMLANAVWLRGAYPSFLVCDSFLPACQRSKFTTEFDKSIGKPLSPTGCQKCINMGGDVWKESPFPVYKYSQYLSKDKKRKIELFAQKIPFDQIQKFKEDEIAIGEHALAGALRFFARGDFNGQSNSEIVLRKYFAAALVTKAVMQEVLRQEKIDVVVAHHGIYVPQGIINEVCKKMGVRFVAWNTAYKKGCFIFSHGDTYHKTMPEEPLSKWQNFEMDENIRRQLDEYLVSRHKGTQDWIKFHEDSLEEPTAIFQKLNLDPKVPVVTLLSNVVWDAQLHYSSNAFPGMVPWVLKTIEIIAKRSDLQLVIRVHPAEVTGFVKSRQFLVDEIKEKYPELPKNVRVIGPDEQISTYALCSLSDTVLIYNTKTGIEIAAFGDRVVVAGEAWIRNKGFSIDVSSETQYESVISQLPIKGKLSKEDLNLAQKYAYHVFFRRMIPLDFLEAHTRTELDVLCTSLDTLAPGKSEPLDVICSGILEGKDFIFKAETQRAKLSS